MPSRTSNKDLSLRGLELFQICAQKGSLQAVAVETGLSISTVSHHLKTLEDHLGVALFDHNRRPMKLTPKGQVFLRSIDGALLAIRKAKAEAVAGDITDASYLRIGAIEDFDSDIIPELAVYLSSTMPSCDFLYHTDTSHEIIQMLRNRQLEIGVTTRPPERLRDLEDRPLMREPFVVVLPKRTQWSAEELLAKSTPLPFLRFASNQIIAKQIEAQLRRLGISSPNGFESASSQTLMAMVAAGAGWTITTPLLFSRAKRFQDQLSMHPFPSKSFHRTLALVSSPDCAEPVRDLVEQRLRRLIQSRVIDPLVAGSAWLGQDFKLI